MVTYARIAFPLRTISLFSFYIILNTILYSKDHMAQRYVISNLELNIFSHPSLPDDLLRHINQNYMNFPKYKTYVAHIKGWVIIADIFIIFLTVCLVFGFLANYPYKTIFLSLLHFVGIILCTYMVISSGSINFLICGVVFGMILPGLIEIYNLIYLFTYRKDFYVPRDFSIF